MLACPPAQWTSIAYDSTVEAPKLIPRIYLKPPGSRYPFDWQRLQYPLKVAYCMTINKYGRKRV